ncbi:hypothetical protein GCM10009821_29440 [Aeromicrobium halocynthiae]|uniref:DNRLRE domain-containing protein n=2 Tax=Aeromicrobium halocynthiae TaxID=560557 RepID=A0ABN2W7S2_9ACTN
MNAGPVGHSDTHLPTLSSVLRSRSRRWGLTGVRGRASRTAFRGAAFVAVVGLTVSLMAAPGVAVEAQEPDEPVATDPVKSAPDIVSAAVAARAQGTRVLVEGLRTDSETTYANPDGTMTTNAHPAPIRFQDEDGDWQPINLDLGPDQAGTVSAESSPMDVTFAGESADAGGRSGADVVRVVEPTDGGSDAVVVLEAPGELGEPVLEDNTATYEDVKPGVDLFVRTTADGFDQHLIVATPEALAEFTTDDGVVEWRIPVRTKGVTARAEEDGSVSFVDADGTIVSTVVAPLAWDAEIDPLSNDPASVATVDLTVDENEEGDIELVVTPDQEWVTDPSREFPITIDPTYASGSAVASGDRHVSKASPNTNFETSTELRVGTHNGGGDVTRSFINWSLSNFRGKDITSAKLNLYETWSYSCSARSFTVRSSPFTDSSTTWNKQPSPGSTYATVNTAKGFNSSCAAGWVRPDITPLVRTWSTKPASEDKLGVRLAASSETDSYGWKKFASKEASNSSLRPYISYTFNRAPGTPSVPSLASTSGASYSPPNSTTATSFSNSLTPTVSVKGSDPDASRIKYEVQFHSSTAGTSASLIASCTTPLVASGSAGTCKPSSSLGLRTIHTRSKTIDERNLAGGWSGWSSFTTTSAAPPVPVVSCPDPHSNGSWEEDAPSADITCTITAADGTLNQAGYIDVTVDGAAKQRVKITPSASTGTARTTVKVSKKAGFHKIIAAAVGRGGLTSANVTYSFGWGGASLTAPEDQTSTSSRVTINAASSPRNGASSVQAKLQWRPRGSDEPWENGPDLTTTAKNADDPVTATGRWNPAEAVKFENRDLPTRTPMTFEIQVCFTYQGSSTPRCTGDESPTTVTRLPHAFGAGYPTTDAGAANLALLTGELSESATDVSVPGFSSDLTISRSHLSFTGSGKVSDWPNDPATSIFGPGFTANLDGPEAGAADMQIIDNTRIDGTIVLQDAEGEVLVYGSPSMTRTYQTGTWIPVTQETAEDGSAIELTGTGAAMTLTLTDIEGTATAFKPVTYAPSGQTPWKPVAVTEVGQTASSTFGYDTNGRITSITAAVPGADCSTSAAASAQRGCRSMIIGYGTTNSGTDATPGDRTGQVKQISSRLWNPDTSTLETTPMVSYAYDGSGRLRTVKDERANLTAAYTWIGAGSNATTRIATVTPPGLAPWKYTYDDNGRLARTERANPSGAGADIVTGRYVYGVETSGPGLPNLTGTTTSKWKQASEAEVGYAVFGPDYTGPVTGSGVDWTYADLQYIDAKGYVVNTVSYGAGTWQATATDYDATGHPIRELDAGAIRTILDAETAGEPIADVDQLSTQTTYNDAILGEDDKVILPAGTVVTEVREPAHEVTNNKGEIVLARQRTTTTYDENAPDRGINLATGQRYALPTTVTVTAAASGTGDEDGDDIETISVTKTGYAKVVAGDANEGDGWTLGTPTTTTIAGETRTTRYDTLGRTIETRQPLSDGNDAGTRKTIYYTAGANAADAACGNKPEWNGLTCRTYLAAAPTTTETPANGPASLPDERTTYDRWLNTAQTVETSAGATRTTTTTHDGASRVIKSVTTAQIPGSTALPGTFTSYDPATGLVAYVGKLNGAGNDATSEKTTYTYDAWGRETERFTDQGAKITTAYDTSSRPVTVTDPTGTTTTVYDGDGERRGLVTGRTVTREGGSPLEFTAAYDASGQMVTQTLPGAITQTTTYDPTGAQVGLTYTGQVTPTTVDPDTGAITTGEPERGEWIAFSRTVDVTGRATNDYATDGAVFANDDDEDAPDIGDAGAFNRSYTYNAAGRLTTVDDRTSAAGQPFDETTVCVRRDYTFDANGRRTTSSATTDADTDCDTGAKTTRTHKYDTGDRPTTGANGQGTYTYDAFGRQTTLPAADAPDPDAGPVTLGYFDTDLARTITQGNVTTTFDLDSAQRRKTQTTTSSSGSTTTVRYYADDSDNPAWTTTGADRTRYTASIGGDLGATIELTKTSIALANLHDDIVTNIVIPNGQTTDTPTTGIDGWSDYTEYGTPIDPEATTQVGGNIGYGWLGAKQRSSSGATAGLTLMGVRLYNPATGRFTSIDPVEGGSDTIYAYPTDPLNQVDLDGEFWAWAVRAGWNGARAYAGRAVARSRVWWRTAPAASSIRGWVAQPRVTLGWRQHRVKVQWDKANHTFKGKFFPGRRRHIAVSYWKKNVKGSHRRIQIPFGRRRG